MIAWPVATALATVCVDFGCSGALLLRARRFAVGALLLFSAILGASALIAGPAGASDRAVDSIFAAAGLGAFPLAVCAYPRWDWRHPVEFVAVSTIAASGTVAVATADEASSVTTMTLLSTSTLFGLLWWRIERGPAGDRPAMLWIALGLGTAALLGGVAGFLNGDSTPGGTVAAGIFVIVGPAMVIGVRRPDMADVRRLLVGAVVLAVALLLYVAVFVGVVSAFQLDGDRTPPLGALGVIGALCALGLHPTTVVLRGVIDTLLFGDRPAPLQAATHVADRIGDDPVLALRAIREALVLPYASLRADGRELAASGTAVTRTRTLPLALGADSVGEIVVGLRAGDLTLGADDEGVLRIVAPLLAQTIRARALARDLQTSRGQAIAGIEEERRRLRRDLHDGLGPTLTGVAFATDAARNKLRDDPSAADELLARLRADTSDAIAEVRRLVEGLRPPALDELGLVAAIRQQAAHMHAASGAALDVTISAPEPMPDLPAAAEVAAYRIVVEALTNVARHSTSETAHVALTLGTGTLGIVVADQGTADAPWTAGAGMTSMRERAEQVGGRLVAGADATGGRVQATIPLGDAELLP